MLEFLEQISSFYSADSDTDATVTCSGVVWSCPLVSRRTDIDLPLEFVIFMGLHDSSLPQNWWYQYLQFGWNLVPYELVPLPKTPPVTPLLRFLYRKQHFLDFSLRRLLANALIQPHFDYASSALLNKRLTKRIQTDQNKCIRFCLNLNNRAHIGIKEFKNINWLPTKERFEQCTTAKVFKFFDSSVPSYMSEMFLPVGQSRITRRSKNKLNQLFRKSNKGQNCLSYLGPKLWNNLPSELKSAKNIDSFKNKITDKFFNDLQSQDDSPYIYY